MYRRADAGDHVFALRVHQELAVELLRAGGGIAGKAHAGAAGLAQIAEDHGLHVDRGAQHVVNVVDAAIVLGAIVQPGAEHGVARHHQLLVRVLREVALGVLLHHLLVFGDDFLQRLGVDAAQFGMAHHDIAHQLAVVAFPLRMRMLRPSPPENRAARSAWGLDQRRGWSVPARRGGAATIKNAAEERSDGTASRAR